MYSIDTVIAIAISIVIAKMPFIVTVLCLLDCLLLSLLLHVVLLEYLLQHLLLLDSV